MKLHHYVILSHLLGAVLVSAGTLSIPYSAHQENSQISLAIYDQQGRLVRTLLTGAPRRQQM